ncbi:NUP88-like protein [Mya arenaria]|uniref:NUP88-like protein n=1 Tax=Mya arenaria TaxID=6604 RepID=A0ABY7E654_MYAAR|nr:NUP88-like protein [Mya arenaria]
MASVDKWRTCLNEKSFCKKIREHNGKESIRKSKAEAKSLIAVNDNDLFIWDNASCHFYYFNLNNLTGENENKNRFQILQCTDPPQFDVEWLVWNIARTHLALWGQLGVTVLELPQKWGKFAEFQGGKDTVACKCVAVGEHYFSSHTGIKLLQVTWHPGSSTDSHVVFLTSDNLISIYDIVDPERPSQTIFLGETEASYTSLSVTRPSTSSALGDNVVAFDFGTPTELYKKAGSVQGAKGPTKLPVQGALLMYPPAEDNYGTDACCILYLPTTPPVVVLATCEGRLHHCVLLPRELDETTLQSESSYRSSVEDVCLYSLPEEPLMFVTETIELELSLTMPQFGDEPSNTSSPERYHCCHAAGVHTVALPWLHNFTEYCTAEEDGNILPALQESIVEHLICTKPLPSSPFSPVLGLAQVKDASLGTILLCLTSDYEFQCLRLSNVRYASGDISLSSVSSSRSIPSPLRKISREPFDNRIRKILQRNTSNPLIKSRSKTELSQQECFKLLTRATQVFQEEYLQKQDLAMGEIKRSDQKEQQRSELGSLQGSRNELSENAERLANMCEECKEKQEDILKRVEGVMKRLQSRNPFLSEAERTMKRELENIYDRLETYERSLEQLRVKRDYQQRQINMSRGSNQASPVIKKSQVAQLRDVLKQEGDEVSDLMKKLNQLKVDSAV